MLQKSVFAILSVLLLTLGGPGTCMAGPAFGGGCGGNGVCDEHLDVLSQDEIDGLRYMREEEKLARDIYLTMSDEWGLIIFSNIARAEQTHMDAVRNLLEKYDVEDPIVDEGETHIGVFFNTDLAAMFDDFKARGLESSLQALQVGAEIEETDLLDIQSEIDLATHADIISTYENLVCGSMNHLRAFVMHIELQGEIYDPLYLEPEELSGIVGAPVARACGGTQKR